MPEPSLTKFLGHARRRLMLIGGTAALLWALVAAALLLLIGVWLDLVWELSPELRIGTLVVVAATALVTVAMMAARTLRLARDAWLARRLDDAGGTGGVIVSGWELAMASPRSSAADLTSQLAQLAVAHASQVAAHVPLAAAVPSRPARRAGTALAGVIALLAVLALLMPGLARTEWDRFTRPQADVPPFSTLVFQVDPGDTQVVYGQGLDVYVVALGEPADRLELVYRDPAGEQALAMFAQSDGRWRASLARITEPSSYFVRAGRARSRHFQVGVITVPRIEEVKFRIASPAYTREAVYEGPLPKDGIVGLAWTHVAVTARSNRPLSAGQIEIVAGGEACEVRLKPAATGNEEVRGEFTITADGKFELRVTDVDHQVSQDALAGSITLLEDRRPLVRLLEPPLVSLATPSAHLPVTIAAEDDYGLARVQLYRSLNNSRPLPLDVSLPAPPPRRWQQRLTLPLAAYGLSPGDEIKLFARVEDNDPAGSKGSESQVVTVRIIGQDEFERMVRAEQGLQVLISKYQQAERRTEALAAELERLAERLSKADPDSPLAQELRDAMERLAEQMQEDAAAIAEAKQHLLPFDIDRHLSQQLDPLAKELREAAAALAAAAGAGRKAKDAADEVRRLADSLAARRRQFQEQATEPLEHLAKIYPLLEDEARFVELVRRQRDLAERLAALRGQDNVDDPAVRVRMRDLEDEQRRLREQLDTLVDDIENHATELPDDDRLHNLKITAWQFVAAVRGSGAFEAMSGAEAALAEFAGTRGHQEAERAAKILEALLSECEGLGAECLGCLGFNPGLTSGMGNSVGQLLEAAGYGSGSSGYGMGGSGYSARRGGLSNVGLYGGLPSALGGASLAGSGRSDPQASSPGLQSGGSLEGDPSLADEPNSTAARGSSQGTIPPRFRKRVGQYFQRITEEARQ